jgi:putative membrane protein
MKKIIVMFFILLLSLAMASAHGEETFAEAEELIEIKIDCDQLTDDQLEAIGDYYMEQMHPGEAHEAMDEQMGGEGSASLRQMHINMARSFYCGEHDMMGSNMMNIMMGRGMMNNDGIGGIMGDNNMIGSSERTGGWRMINYMFPFGTTAFGMFFGFLFMLIFWGAIIWLIVWLVRQYAQPKRRESALDILKKRYAKGSITKKEFELMKKEIE